MNIYFGVGSSIFFQGTIIVCTNCDEGYHVKCHVPKPKIPWKKWLCRNCAPQEPKQTTPGKTMTQVFS